MKWFPANIFIVITSLALNIVPQGLYADITTTSKAAILIDAKSGYVLYEKNADLSIPPASMSKMMTIYLIFDALKNGDIKLDDKFHISENAWRQEGSRMFLKVNDKVSVENLLKGAIIQSGNDACVALAEGLSGSVDGFVLRMNNVAKKLNLTQSSFANPTGLPHENHRMSVRDLASLGRALVDDFPEYYPIYSAKEFTWNKIKQSNRNPLLTHFAGADGIKTGHTKEAGYCLVGSAKRDNMHFISVVSGLGSNKERRHESVKILGYGFSAFETLTLKKDKNIAKIPVYLGKYDSVDVTLKDNLDTLTKRLARDLIKAEIQYNLPLIAPINKGDVVGKIFITTQSQPNKIGTDIVASTTILKTDFIGRIWVSLHYFLFGAPKFNSDIAL